MVLFVRRHPCKLVLNASKFLILGVMGLRKACRSSCWIGGESSVVELKIHKIVNKWTNNTELCQSNWCEHQRSKAHCFHESIKWVLSALYSSTCSLKQMGETYRWVQKIFACVSESSLDNRHLPNLHRLHFSGSSEWPKVNGPDLWPSSVKNVELSGKR